MPTPVNELVLSKQREKILTSLYKGKTISSDKIRSEKYSFLIYYALVTSENGNYVISEKGVRYVLSHRKDNFRFWFPTIISILALIVSFIALLA